LIIVDIMIQKIR